MIDTSDIKEARKLIDKISGQKNRVVIHGRDIRFNRMILENKKVDMLVLSHKDKKDRLKQRDSGLNHVLCKIARQNDITLAINLEELRCGGKKERAEILSRIIQNIKLMKKAKNKVKLINFNDKIQAQSLLLSLGMPTDMAKKAVV